MESHSEICDAVDRRWLSRSVRNEIWTDIVISYPPGDVRLEASMWHCCEHTRWQIRVAGRCGRRWADSVGWQGGEQISGLRRSWRFWKPELFFWKFLGINKPRKPMSSDHSDELVVLISTDITEEEPGHSKKKKFPRIGWESVNDF